MNNPVKRIGRAEINNFLLVTLGTVLTAVGIYFFKFPNNFSTGGVSGISILLGRLVPFLSPAVTMWAINLICCSSASCFSGAASA